MLKYVLSGALCLIVAGKAGAQVQRSDGDTFRTDVLPALQLITEPAFAAIVKPYADCFSTVVATSSASSLKDDQTVERAQLLADMKCQHLKETVTKEADASLILRSPSLSAEARAHLLGKVRRQATFFALMAAYQRAGKGPILQKAVEQYADPASCLAALDEWVRSSREEERRNPTHTPSTWRLNGPQRVGSGISYDLTRIAVQDYGTNRHTVAYIYARSCDGPAMTIVTDGWVTDDLLLPSLP